MDFSQAGTLSLEGSCALLLSVIAYKLYRAQIRTHSGCCGGAVEIDTTNVGVSDPSSV